MRQDIIKTLHSIGHPSINETVHRISSHYYWGKAKEEITTFVKQCHNCLSVKPNKQKNQMQELHLIILGQKSFQV